MSKYFIEAKGQLHGNCFGMKPITLSEIMEQEGLGWRSVEEKGGRWRLRI